MTIFEVLKLVGGLALFLYGMDVMGKSLEKQAGGKLQSILAKLTANPLKGFLLGAAVTAIIQSSSATTVMVVGFVNSGIMQLRQAIGIIMGANVGTTVTSWLLSLTGIEGSSIFVQLLKPSSFTPILALIGIIMRMTKKKEDVGTILLGFAVLMFGMDAMSAAVKPLANVPEFTQLLTVFTNPILGVLMGALLTAIIQSSSASVGILQALSVTGAITYGNALPIIMGQNIGTCVTAMLSSIGANKNARRAAIVHLYFNIIGVVVFLVLFYAINAIVNLPFVTEPIGAMGIAVIHTCFNVLATAVMLPFTKGLEKLAYLTIRDDHKEQKVELLDERLFTTPGVAVARSNELTQQMAHLAKDTLMKAVSLTAHYDPAVVQEVTQQENQLDSYEDKLGTYLVRLSQRELTPADSRQVSQLLHSISDLERIGDHAANIVYPLERQPAFSEAAQGQLDKLYAAIEEILTMTVDAFAHDDARLAKRIEPLEQVVDEMTTTIRNQHIERLKQGKCTIDAGIVLLDILTNMERVADHCSNIASAMIEVRHDALGLHEYLGNYEESPYYKRTYAEFATKYSL
ncbi:MAG: Na/Pi cotransporter family protein [Firmicutes bacterium]|nr:Na/Pi cotransporter family protein [Bacillota bacterium]